MEAHKPQKIEAPEKSREERDLARDRGERGSDGSHDHLKKEEGKPAQAVNRAARASKAKNNVRKLRMERMMSKAELARRAGVSTLTIDRVERGMPCRMDTKRKILEALGLKPSDRVMVFGDSPDDLEEKD
jgi:DNA-binding XRE family transcriptional regulator